MGAAAVVYICTFRNGVPSESHRRLNGWDKLLNEWTHTDVLEWLKEINLDTSKATAFVNKNQWDGKTLAELRSILATEQQNVCYKPLTSIQDNKNKWTRPEFLLAQGRIKKRTRLWLTKKLGLSADQLILELNGLKYNVPQKSNTKAVASWTTADVKRWLEDTHAYCILKQPLKTKLHVLEKLKWDGNTLAAYYQTLKNAAGTRAQNNVMRKKTAAMKKTFRKEIKRLGITKDKDILF